MKALPVVMFIPSQGQVHVIGWHPMLLYDIKGKKIQAILQLVVQYINPQLFIRGFSALNTYM